MALVARASRAARRLPENWLLVTRRAKARPTLLNSAQTLVKPAECNNTSGRDPCSWREIPVGTTDSAPEGDAPAAIEMRYDFVRPPVVDSRGQANRTGAVSA